MLPLLLGRLAPLLLRLGRLLGRGEDGAQLGLGGQEDRPAAVAPEGLPVVGKAAARRRAKDHFKRAELVRQPLDRPSVLLRQDLDGDEAVAQRRCRRIQHLARHQGSRPLAERVLDGLAELRRGDVVLRFQLHQGGVEGANLVVQGKILRIADEPS